MIKLIIFDWGDVCGLYNLSVFDTFLQKLGHDPKIATEHFKTDKSAFDRGNLTEAQFWEKLAEKVGFKGSWAELAHANEKNLQLNSPVLDYAKELRKNNKVILLSNMDPTSIQAIKRSINLSDYFEKAYFSSELKKGKLEKEVVDKITADFSVQPEEMLFIDDFPGNVERAATYGMKTILFVGVDDLKKKVKQSLQN